MGGVARVKQSLSLGLSVLLILSIGPAAPTGVAYQTAPAAGTASSYPGQGVPATAEELQAVVAPIALYPDALVAQILTAATYPDQVAIASYWLEDNKSLTGSALVTAVNAQTWDPSVKALTQFPSVLSNMASNLSWTSQLGEDYHNQQADVMTAIQTLRAKAKAAGNLKTTPQVTVVQQSPQVIVIQPTNPQIVYVPTYNPAVVYGYPYVVPAYVYVPPPSTADVVAAGLIGFGVGIAVGAMMSSSWGYSTWDCHWYGSYGAYYHGTAYYGNSAWHGGYYGSSASAYGAYGSAHASEGYNPSTGTYARGASTSTAYGNAKSRPGLQPLHRSVRRDPSRFQRVFELGQLHGLEGRHHCGLATLLGRQRDGLAQPKAPTATSTPPRTATSTRTPEAAGRARIRIPAPRTVGEAAAIRTITAATLHPLSAAGAANLVATPAGAPDLRARRVGAAEAAAVAGAAAVVVRATDRAQHQKAKPREDLNVRLSPQS